ncbi:cilia- and flagella-associated protein 184-like [Onthophagus taurus]|uniref:cilia- and flagella-associated protein 184-like n=1 Tax=Onthophagus taurus TaxID=166361 RepID=UPI0039BE567D
MADETEKHEEEAPPQPAENEPAEHHDGEDQASISKKGAGSPGGSSQGTINLEPKMNAKSDFAMKEEHDDMIVPNAKDDKDEKSVSALVAFRSDTDDASSRYFLEGEEAFVVSPEEAFGVEEIEGEYEMEAEEWYQEASKKSSVTKVKKKRRKSIAPPDFGMMPGSGSGLLGALTQMRSFESVSDEEREQSVAEEGEEEAVHKRKKDEEEEEEEEEIVDREPYYDLYKALLAEYPMIKMKNNFLQRKMAEYFKKRKMEHVLREGDHVEEAEQKYFAKLDALSDLKNVNDMQRNAITAELNEMRELRNSQYASVLSNFEGMLNREKEIGTGLIFTKTAKEIPEKLLERLIKNQRLKSNEITDMRLRYIKLRNSIDEVTQAIQIMDKIGESHTLMDYEQLKMENQNYADKIEERDEELAKLREKCSGAIQILAHLREKSAAMDLDIIEMADKLDEAVVEKNEFRERVADLKHERDTLRSNIVRLQEDSGLLTKRKLLLDMEDTLDQITNIKMEVEKVEKTYQENAKALNIIKHNIKVEREAYQNRAFKLTDVVCKKPKVQKVYKGRNNIKIGSSLEKFDINL